MRRTAAALICALGLSLSASPAFALTIGDAFYLGNVVPGSPASAAEEVGYINVLIGLAADVSAPVLGDVNTTVSGHSYDRSSLTGSFTTAVTTGGDQGNAPPGGPVNVTGWTYILAKYGDRSHVWVNDGSLGSVTIPTSGPGKDYSKNNGLSHYSLYNPGLSVPDGGVTALLLGIGLMGLGLLRQRM